MPVNLVLILLFFAIAAFAQQTSVAVLPSDGTVLNREELEALTDEMREAALKILPTSTFTLLKQDVVVKRLGGAENFIKECKESTCIVDLGKKAQVDYVAQASVIKLGNRIRLKVELYNVRTEGLVGMFNDEAENIRGLLAAVKKKAPEVFGKISGTSSNSKDAFTNSVAGGISGVQTAGGGYEFDGEKSYLVNLSTEPPGAVLSFDGVPSASCTKTPCKAELREGNVRIIAMMEQHEKADTTVSIKRNNQNIAMTLKPNFGVLQINPVYLDGIGKDIQWNLTINGKSSSLGEIRLSPNKYSVKLSHECYESIGFDVGINKGKREVFNMAGNITLKKGGLNLSAEQNGQPASEPIFVNDKRVGETPFSGSVPICAKVEIGKNKEFVDVKLKYNEKVKYTYKGNIYESKSQGENKVSNANNTGSSSALKKCDAVFNPNKKFCYDGEIYNLCDGVPYNPTTHICSDDIASRALCNGVQYNPLIHICKKNNIVAECGAAIYNPATHGCKDNTVLPKCGTVVYDPSKHICKDNNLFPKCGANIYNPATHFCEYNTVFPKCGTIVYDPATQACKGNVLISRCGTNVYDPATHGCKDHTVFPKCGTIIYDPAIQVCKDNTVFSRCGATEYYNPQTQECRFGAVFQK